MLVDITIDRLYNAQIVAGELENAGLEGATLYWRAYTVRGTIKKRLLSALSLVPGVLSVIESDGTKVDSHETSIIRSSGDLDLCNPNAVLSHQQLRERYDDLVSLSRTRRGNRI